MASTNETVPVSQTEPLKDAGPTGGPKNKPGKKGGGRKPRSSHVAAVGRQLTEAIDHDFAQLTELGRVLRQIVTSTHASLVFKEIPEADREAKVGMLTKIREDAATLCLLLGTKV